MSLPDGARDGPQDLGPSQGERARHRRRTRQSAAGWDRTTASRRDALDPIVAARIKMALLADPTKDLSTIYAAVHKEMQQEQAAQQSAQPLSPGAPRLWAEGRPRHPTPPPCRARPFHPEARNPSRSTHRRARASSTFSRWWLLSERALKARPDGPRPHTAEQQDRPQRP